MTGSKVKLLLDFFFPSKQRNRDKKNPSNLLCIKEVGTHAAVSILRIKTIHYSYDIMQNVLDVLVFYSSLSLHSLLCYYSANIIRKPLCTVFKRILHHTKTLLSHLTSVSSATHSKLLADVSDYYVIYTIKLQFEPNFHSTFKATKRSYYF